MSKTLKQPSIFRVLIIDDQVCSGRGDVSARTFQEGISAYIRHVIAEKNKEEDAEKHIDVDICFAATPEEGVNRWKNEVFDLTLVDSDLKSSATTPKDKTEIQNFLDIIPSLKGAYIFRLLWDLMTDESDDNPYKKYRNGCRVAFWTGLRSEYDEKRLDKLKKILAPCCTKSDVNPCGTESDVKWFIPKRENDPEADWDKDEFRGKVTTLEECIYDVLGKLQKDIDISCQSLLARLISLYRIKSPDEFKRLTGLKEWVECGFLYVDGNNVCYTDSLKDKTLQYVKLSPCLRYGNPSFKALIKNGEATSEEIDGTAGDDEKKETRCFSKTLLEIREKYDGIIIPGDDLPSQDKSRRDNQIRNRRIIAAATPLTGCSAVGRKHSIDLMVRKIKALLDGPFDQVVLKTVYLDSLDQWDNLHWPTLQAQSHHRTRCLRSTAHPRTLWNTGITALESFTPEMMHEFLSEFAKTNPQKCQYVIVSLGSKFPQWDLNKKIKRLNEELKACDTSGEEEPLKTYRNHILNFSKHIGELRVDLEKIWQSLFLRVFEKSEKDDESDKADDNLRGNKTYPIVEINVRHYLRECVAYHLGGHEYLSPAKIDPDRTKNELDFTGCYQSLDLEFGSWLEVLDEVAKNFGKKLLLKLPFRGDLLHFIRLIRDYVNEHEGTAISGITLINAFKSGVVESERGVTYSPAWYGRLDAWHDAAERKWTYQMSGELLTASRNELLGEVLNLGAKQGLEVQISGGIVDAEGIRYCSLVSVAHPEKCIGCTLCKEYRKDKDDKTTKVCKNDAITIERNKPPVVIDLRKCIACGECVGRCQKGVIVRLPVQIGTWALMDLNLSLGNNQWLSCANVPPSIGNGRPAVTGCRKTCSPCHVRCRNGAFSPGGNGNAARIDIGKCVECKECLRMCPHGAITLGIDKVKTMNHADDEAQISKRINPRIAFCLHELCNGCGKCSRTFYCDTFMNRRGLELPPVMDSRNCTGCGLCAQTCPRGAIQLFKPEHVAVLIGTGDILSAWHRRLTAYEIPHLVFSQDEIEKNYAKWEEKSSAQQMEEIWEYRKEYDLFFNKMSPDDYTDDRNWDEFARSILAKKELDDDIIQKWIFIQKWLFLTWSDPGQVLKNSPVIYAIDDENCVYFETSMEKPQKINRELPLPESSVFQGMKSIITEVNKRLNNLREVK